MTHPGKPVCWFRMFLLAVCLLGLQLALVGHGTEHALHAHEGTDQACIECLALPSLLAVPTSPAAKSPLPLAWLPLTSAASPAPSFSHFPFFRGRAPPELHD